MSLVAESSLVRGQMGEGHGMTVFDADAFSLTLAFLVCVRYVLKVEMDILAGSFCIGRRMADNL